MKIRRMLPLALVALTMAFAGCGGGKNGKNNDKVKVVNDVRLPGDSTFYGLACDGCTDSVLVVLPADDSDPVSFNIIGAMRDRKVFGRPKIGDMMAVVVNKSDRRKADMVIDIEELKGTWVYLSMPKMRKHAPMGGKPTAMPKPDPERDSMMKAMMVPIEQGFKIKKNYLMDPVGLRFKQTDLNGDSPLEYPQVKFYKEWNILNGKLVFTEGTIEIGNRKRKKARPVRDTVEIVMMMKDSLQLKFKDGIKAYYRK